MFLMRSGYAARATAPKTIAGLMISRVGLELRVIVIDVWLLNAPGAELAASRRRPTLVLLLSQSTRLCGLHQQFTLSGRPTNP